MKEVNLDRSQVDDSNYMILKKKKVKLKIKLDMTEQLNDWLKDGWFLWLSEVREVEMNR